MTTVAAAVAAAAILTVAARWWTRRGGDVPAGHRMVVAAGVVTALAVPAWMAFVAGVELAGWWILLVPLAWIVAGVTSVIEQHLARLRDRALGQPARAVLWPTWVVAATAAVTLDGVTVAVLLAWGSVATVDEAAVLGVIAAAFAGIIVLTLTQHLRRRRAAGAIAPLERLEPPSCPRGPTLTGLCLLALVGIITPVWVISPTTGPAGTLDLVALAGVIVAAVPGWCAAGLAWIVASPAPPPATP